MPRVPVYGGPQVERTALRPAFQGGVDVSSGLQQVARGVGQVGQEIDRQQTRDAETQANTVDTNITAGWLEWDAQARRKYQGQNVGEYETAAREWWDKAKGAYAADISPLAAQSIGMNLARKRAQALGSVVGYVNTEKEKVADQQSEAAAQTTIEMAIDTGDTVGGAARVRQLSAQVGARKGWTTEQVQADQQRLLGTMHTARITKLAETDAKTAQAYFQANKTEIPATAQVRIEGILKGEADNQFAVQYAAERAGKPLSEQLADAAKIDDPQRREKTLLQIRNNHAMVEAANVEREKAAADQAWQLVGQGRRVPEAVLLRMDGRQRVQLQEHLIDRARMASERSQPKTDWATYIDARERLARGENVDLRPLTTKIAGPQMEQLLDLKTAGTKAGPKQDEMITDHQRIQIALTGLGIDAKKHPDEAGLFTSEVDRRVRAESAARGGKNLTADEKQKVVDAVAMDKVYTPGFLMRGDAKPLALIKAEDLGKVEVEVNGKMYKSSSVPMQDRVQIIEALKAGGRLATEQAIVELYLRGQRKPAASGTVK
jgi:hypothetical protein